MTKRPEKKKVVKSADVEKKKSIKPLNEVFDKVAADNVDTDADIETDPDKIAVAIFVQSNVGKTPVIGVRAVADFLGYSMRTIHSWRAEFPDFPVISDGVCCVWRSTEEDLRAWQDAHLDLFSYRKERLENAERYKKQLARRRRWS